MRHLSALLLLVAGLLCSHSGGAPLSQVRLAPFGMVERVESAVSSAFAAGEAQAGWGEQGDDFSGSELGDKDLDQTFIVAGWNEISVRIPAARGRDALKFAILPMPWPECPMRPPRSAAHFA